MLQLQNGGSSTPSLTRQSRSYRRIPPTNPGYHTVSIMRATIAAVLLQLYISSTQAPDSQPKPSTLTSPSTGGYYDLNAITVQPPKDHKPAHKDDRSESWHARGYDYGTKFTLNFCAPVIETLEEVVGIPEGLWRNVSAFYERNGKVYSIG